MNAALIAKVVLTAGAFLLLVDVILASASTHLRTANTLGAIGAMLLVAGIVLRILGRKAAS